MPRPGAVIEVDRNTPPVLFHFGEGIRLEKLPLGARIVYPPDPLDPIAHPERAIKRALARPLEDDPLKSLLRAGMKLTIAFDDLSLPLPPMAAPDVRQLVMEEVIDMAAEAGIDEQEVIDRVQKLLDERKSRPGAVESWFLTHPLEEDRINAVQTLINQIPPARLAQLGTDTRNFHAFKSRIQSLPPSPPPRQVQ